MRCARRVSRSRSNTASTAAWVARAAECGTMPCTGTQRSPAGPSMLFGGVKGWLRSTLGMELSTSRPPAPSARRAHARGHRCRRVAFDRDVRAELRRIEEVAPGGDQLEALDQAGLLHHL